MSVDGGSTSPLLGSFFMGMAEAAGGSETLDGAGLAAAFEAGLAKLRAQTPAKVGDKTMIDALVPAVEALRQAADAGAEPAGAAGPGGRRRPARRREHQRVAGPLRPGPEPGPAHDRPRRSRRHVDRAVVRRLPRRLSRSRSLISLA